MGEFVSIIISTYHSKTLHYVLDALEKQTSKQFEVIVCDDGSKDFKYIRTQSYPLRYVWHQDLGRHWSRTHNEGIALAKGKYIMFLHDDIIPANDIVELALKLMKPNMILTGVRSSIPRTSRAAHNPKKYVFEEDHRLRFNKTIFNAYDHSDKNCLVQLSRYFADPFNLVSGCLMVFPTEALRVVGGAPEDFPGQGFEDYDIALRLMRNGLEIYLSFGIHGYHLDHKELSGPEVDKNNIEFVKRMRDVTYTKNFNYLQLL